MAETPAQALSILQDGHGLVLAAIEGVPEELALRRGLGGGEWSIKDLLAHLTSWEEHALAALDAWAKGDGAPVYKALAASGIDGVNQQTFVAKADISHAQVLGDFEAVHRRLLDALSALHGEAWASVPEPERNRTLGAELGGILAGPGAFNHHDAHLNDLRDWVAGLRRL